MKRDQLGGYYRSAADRRIDGVRLQFQRCTKERQAEILFFESNFLVVAVARLREVAWKARKDLGKVEISTALDRFDEAHPEFRDVRNYQEHILDPALIGTSMYFAGGALVRLRGDFGSETLIDPVRLAEDAEALHRSICNVLGPPPPPKNWVVRPLDRRRRSLRKRTAGTIGRPAI